MDADDLSVRPPSTTDYGVYGSSEYMQGVRVRFGEPGDGCFRPVGAAISNQATAESRSVFSDWAKLTGGDFRYNYEKLDMEWAVRITYQQMTPDSANDKLLLYTNLDNTLSLLELTPETNQGPQTMVDIIICETVEKALTVVQRISNLDLAAELKDQVFPRNRLASAAPLDDPHYNIVDIRTDAYPESVTHD